MRKMRKRNRRNVEVETESIGLLEENMQSSSRKLEEYTIRTKHYIVEAVDKMLEQELPILTAEKFALFHTTGNRLTYETDYFAKRKFLTVFGVAAQWMIQENIEQLGKVSKEAVMQKLEKILYSVCEEECWALPAHVNPDEANWRNTIDLFATETAQTLADVVAAVGVELNGQCVLRVKENVQRRVLQPFFETSCNTYSWEQCDNNWNAVCNGNIGSAYLHSLGESEKPNPQYIERVCKNLLHYINGFAEDGTCKEGLSYYFYGMTYMVNLANELYQMSEGAIDLLRGAWGSYKAGETDKRARIAEWWAKCFFSAGRTVSFSDGNSKDKYRMGLACALAEHYSTIYLPDTKRALVLEEDACYRYLPFKMDFFCTMHYIEYIQQQKAEIQITPEDKIRILKEAQWCVGEAILNNSGFACKGGHNGEPHNHNDLGSFLYVVGKDMFLTDLGAGEYTKDYFSDKRYDILCNRSLGHNVPIVAGEEQRAGAEYMCTNFEAIETEIEVRVTMNLTEAYEVEQLRSFVRQINFEKEKGSLTVEDTFICNEEILITQNLVTQFLPEIEGNSIILIGKGVCHIQVMSSDNKAPNPIRVISMEHCNHQGEREQVYLIQWDRVVEKSHKECFRIDFI